MIATTEERLAALERQLLGQVAVTTEDANHPTGGCHFCGLAVAAFADEDGQCWFPAETNGPDVACFECHGEAHEFDVFGGMWRLRHEHRDVIVSRLLGLRGWEPGIHERVEWRWFFELPAVAPTPPPVAWGALDELRDRADPEVPDDPERHQWLSDLMSPARTPRVRFDGKQAIFDEGPHEGQPARLNRQTEQYEPLNVEQPT